MMHTRRRFIVVIPGLREAQNPESSFLSWIEIDNKHWSAIVTYRGDNIRIISVRRSRTSEVALYES